MHKPLIILIAIGTLLFVDAGRCQAVVFNNEPPSEPQPQSPSVLLPSFDSQDFTYQLRDIANIKEGGADAGGGDLCEDRIKIIREDLRVWIVKGGATQLPLSGTMNVTQYSKAMLIQIGKAKIKCVGQGDPGYPVMMNKTPKVCRYDRTQSDSRITCDFNKFQSMNEADQYVLIHHEFAGLSGVEIANGEDSDYQVSNHVSENLSYETVQKLVIKSNTDSYELIPDNQAELVLRALTRAVHASGASKLLCSGISPHTQEPVKDESIPINYIYDWFASNRPLYHKANGQPTLKIILPAVESLGAQEISVFIATDAGDKHITSISLTSAKTAALTNTNSGTILNPKYSSNPKLTRNNSLMCHLTN